MTNYAPSLVVLLGVTALKQLQVSVVGSLGMLRSYGRQIYCYTLHVDGRTLALWVSKAQMPGSSLKIPFLSCSFFDINIGARLTLSLARKSSQVITNNESPTVDVSGFCHVKETGKIHEL